MTADMSRILGVMRDFAEGRIGADDFVTGYGALWRQIRDNQDSSIDRTPGMAAHLSRLRAQLVSGELTETHFRAALAQTYSSLEGVMPRPGDSVDEVLGHIFVECAAYQPADAADVSHSQCELRGEVKRALEVLDRAQ